MLQRLLNLFRQYAVHAAVLIALLCCRLVNAAEVNISFSQREASIGVPIQLIIEIINADEFDDPQLPEIKGAAVQPTPGRSESTSTFIENGRVSSRRTVRLTYRIVPFEEGTITIPAIRVAADGKTFTSQPMDIVVNKADGGGLLFAEVHADRQAIYLGESLNLRLRLWIRPYQDRSYNVRLSASDMWSTVDLASSTWGDFANALAELRDPFGGLRIQAREVTRDDGEGNQRAYFLYELPVTVWPETAGPLRLDQPRIVVTYPVRLARSDSFFPTGRLAIAESRTLAVVAEAPAVQVMLPPKDGQPETFNGAVGDYDIAITARPTDVAVGDPITLTISVTDRRPGRTRLELLPPPPLDQVPELAQNFRMPSDPLAGTVAGNTKTFTQTIRARRPDVKRIPPIPLSCFDPASQTYTTRQSEPIAITVRSASQVGLGEIVQSPVPSGAPTTTDLTPTEGGILANYAEVEGLLVPHGLEVDRTWAMALAAPPALCVLLGLARLMQQRSGDARVQRKRTAKKRAIARIRTHRDADARDQSQAIIAAVSDYVADRLDLPNGSLTTSEIARQLRGRLPEDEVAELIRILEQCEQNVYAGGAPIPTEELIRQATACISRMERSRWR